MLDDSALLADHNHFGFGAIQSPPDERDLILGADVYAALGKHPLAAETLPKSFRVARPAPILNQGNTPQCVAYSTAHMKDWQDYPDTTPAKWWGFDEAAFFKAIGGTSNGAILRNAMDRLKKVGYPVKGGADATSHHKIKAYYSVPKDITAIKTAIHTLGVVVLATPWYNSWFTPVKGILPRGDYQVGGHAIAAEGWDDRYGLLLANSWGTSWDPVHSGLVYMPYAYVLSTVWEIWKAQDA